MTMVQPMVVLRLIAMACDPLPNQQLKTTVQPMVVLWLIAMARAAYLLAFASSFPECKEMMSNTREEKLEPRRQEWHVTGAFGIPVWGRSTFLGGEGRMAFQPRTGTPTVCWEPTKGVVLMLWGEG